MSFRCGGSIINEKHILTAAHCVTNLKNARLVGVRVGEFDTSTNPDCYGPKDDKFCVSYQDILVEKAIPHPGFLRNSLDDIAIIKLNHSIQYDGKIQLISNSLWKFFNKIFCRQIINILSVYRSKKMWLKRT